MYCRFCGKQIEDSAAFCRHCGKPQQADNLQSQPESQRNDEHEDPANSGQQISSPISELQNEQPDSLPKPSVRRLKKRVGMIIGICGVLIIVVVTLILLKIIPAENHIAVSGAAKVLSGSSASNTISSSSPVSSANSSENAAISSSFSATSSAQASAAVTYRQYTNARYGFSVDYPADLKGGQEPANGDGMNFSSADGSIKLTVSGSNNAMDYTAASYLKNLLSQHPSAAYHECKDDWCIISWTDGSSIVYWKAVVGSGSINEYQITYPVNQKDQFDAVISHISSTFKTPGIDDFH